MKKLFITIIKHDIMNRIHIILTIFLLSVTQIIFAQKTKTDANIIGHVVSNGEQHIPFATVSVKGTTIGVTTDETGHYQLNNLPEGKLIIIAQSLGFKPQEKEITIKAGETKELNFELEQDILSLEQVVITGDRNATKRTESSTIVSTLTPKLFANTQSVTLSEGLNFCSGLRMENNCQNCGFSQVRMNGMEGPYSQILINSRPIFSGLAGVYGLELIPTNMIERVEVVRGGGSALYSSNAIAGTINLILKDPISNSYEFGVNTGLIGVGIDNSGNPAQDYSVNFNTTLVSADNKTGMALYGFYRDREAFDANNDDFSEIASLKNTTIGTRIYHRFGTRNKLTADFFNIKEDRRGGDKFDYPIHEANIAEVLNHNLTTGALTYEQFVRENDLFSVYVSGQRVNRDAYYGAEKSLSDYGNTKDFSYTIGTQYNAKFRNSNLVVGIESYGSWLKDKKLGYADIDNAIIVNDIIISIPHTDNVLVSDQTTSTNGVFAQYEKNWNKLKISVGARFDHYNVEDKEHLDSEKSGNMLSPRLTFKYDIKEYLQARVSYSQGYRAPQIFDEDLHIETSGSRKVIHKNSPDLKQETSHSYMASLDFNKQLGKVYVGLLLEGFYTQLDNPFVNEIGDPDENGTVIYKRVNADDGAKVQGVNIELNVVPTDKFTVKAGFTVQSSKYEQAQEFNEKNFFRTPEDYGYLTLDWQASKSLGISATGNYTGKMLVPYFGLQIPNPDDGELRETERFLDLGLKVRYNIKLNEATLQLFAGAKNIFNSYQSDFDSGVDRDPAYIYGPMNPRTVYFGLKIGNFL
ncbi:MAG TPA: TonB-dependent receptor [Flavobacteriaceae bacterium]|nr:TonB-dependent receptor [Flavobacteriaceae bacterium]